MSQLYLDTALSPLTMHVVNEEGAVFSFSATELRASDSLHTELQKLLKEANLSLKEITHLTLVRGPGSFTGVRIAYTFAEALKLSNPTIYISAVEALEAFAYSQIDHLPEGEEVAVCTNAHGGKIFTQKIVRQADKILLKSDILCVNSDEVTQSHQLSDPSLSQSPSSHLNTPLITSQGMQKATQYMDYMPLYIKPLTYRKLTD